MRKLLLAPVAALALLVAMVATASAHPLGNYTVNRAVVVTVAADRVGVTYLVDMAEIPAFNEIAAVDTNGDGVQSAAERTAYARQPAAAWPRTCG